MILHEMPRKEAYHIKISIMQAPGVGDGQGGLACCIPWGCNESDMTEQLNNNKNAQKQYAQFGD